MMRWITRRWRARQRQLDIQFLWPAIRSQAPREIAQQAFGLHCAVDRAWLDVEQRERERIIAALP